MHLYCAQEFCYANLYVSYGELCICVIVLYETPSFSAEAQSFR